LVIIWCLYFGIWYLSQEVQRRFIQVESQARLPTR
jgi:hypothetical protein